MAKTIWLGVFYLLFSNIFNCAYSQCSSINLPYVESFSSVSLGASCSWTASSVASGSGWSINNTNYAGGASVPEVEAYGNNACAGCVETISLTLTSPINTSTVSSMQVTFLQSLYVHNQATSGPSYGTLKFQTSTDGSNWTDRWSNQYTVSGSGLVSAASGSVSVPAFTPSSANTYIRFTLTGVMFKVWGWEIDDINIIDNSITTDINNHFSQQTALNISVFPNPANNDININIESKENDVYHLQFYDFTGKLIKEYFQTTEQQKIKINTDISNFSPGIYVLKISSHTTPQIFTTKIIKN